MIHVARNLRAKQLANAPRGRSGIAPSNVTGPAAFPVEVQRYRALESSLLHELDLASFEDRTLVAGVAGQRVLDAMTRAGGRLSALGLRRSLADLPNVDVGVRQLVDRGLVYRPTRGIYDFALPLFGSYLRRRAERTGLTGRH